MSQTYSNVLVHLVFSTKHRDPVLVPEVRERLHPYLGGILRSLDCLPIQIGGVEDHVHLLLGVTRKLAMAEVVQKTKTGSSKWMKSHVPGFAWQSGYGVFSVSAEDSQDVAQYIRRQVEHHSSVSFKDEYIGMLNAVGIRYDEQYMWD